MQYLTKPLYHFISALYVSILCLHSVIIFADVHNAEFFTQQAKDARASVWKISQTFTKKQGEIHATTGTGFFIDTNLMLTNAHVMQECLQHGSLHSIKLQQNRNGVLFTSHRKILKVLRVSRFPDFALLQIEKDHVHKDSFLKIRSKSLNVSHESSRFFSILGYAHGQLAEMRKINSHIKKYHNDYDFFTFSVNHHDFFTFAVDDRDFYGASGSPVLDESGAIVGMLSNIDLKNTNIAIFWSNKEIRNFIQGDLGFDCYNMQAKTCINKTNYYTKADVLPIFNFFNKIFNY